ncbi:trans-aconitate methyltransferase [Microbacterium awajiense]|uniref:Trans-aconitate methyltransferase n=1 Tax=Microbacterium awajiense TaxID=415214 RepID=A0ABP7AWS6_9MICO
MTAIVPVSADWLALREPADGRARSLPLARRAAALAGSPAVVHDLGSGTGSMMRWLAPHLDPRQSWVLHDWNDMLLDRAVEQHPVPGAVRTHVVDIARLQAADLAGATLVTASALLDVLTADELAAIVEACVAVGAPVLFALSVVGRVQIDPPDGDDGSFEAAFNAHQRRVVGGRRLLGPDGVGRARVLFADAGWSVEETSTPWRLDATDGALVTDWLDGWLDAAVEQRPELASRAAASSERRASHRDAGMLRVTVHHRDLLAWPP